MKSLREGTRVSSSKAHEIYVGFDGERNQSLASWMLNENMVWYLGMMSWRYLLWAKCYVGEPNTEDYLLTQKGKKPRLEQVVEYFPQIEANLKDFADKVKGIKECLKAGEPIPPLVLSRGRLRHSLWLLDGTHRGIACGLLSAGNPNPLDVTVLISRKMFPWEKK